MKNLRKSGFLELDFTCRILIRSPNTDPDLDPAWRFESGSALSSAIHFSSPIRLDQSVLRAQLLVVFFRNPSESTMLFNSVRYRLVPVPYITVPQSIHQWCYRYRIRATSFIAAIVCSLEPGFCCQTSPSMQFLSCICIRLQLVFFTYLPVR